MVLFLSAVEVITPKIPIIDVQQHHGILGEVGQRFGKRGKAQAVPLHQDLSALKALRIPAGFRVDLKRRILCRRFQGITGNGFLAAGEQGGLQEYSHNDPSFFNLGCELRFPNSSASQPIPWVGYGTY